VTETLTANTLTEREERMLAELLALRVAAYQKAANLLDIYFDPDDVSMRICAAAIAAAETKGE